MSWQGFDIITGLDLLGTLVFAISGVLAAIDKRFDIVGSIIMGFVTAVGGGTLRDLLIGEVPVGWMQSLEYLAVIAVAVPLCYIWKGYIMKLRKSMFLFDTIGLGLFAVLGVQKTLDIGLSPVIAVMMGVVSASFGGVIRDVLSNEVPLIFRKEIYATACLLGGIVYLGLSQLFPSFSWPILVSVLVVSGVRYLAVRYRWTLAVSARD